MDDLLLLVLISLAHRIGADIESGLLPQHCRKRLY